MAEFTETQVQEANKLHDEVRMYLTTNSSYRNGLEQNFVEIGARLAAIKSSLYWKLWGFKNFSTFMGSLDGRSKNYQCMGVAQDLLATIPHETLVKIGLSKAAVLRLMVKGQKPITADLVEQAQKLTRTQLKGIIAGELGLVIDPEEPFLDLGAIPMNDEELAEFYQVVNLIVRAADMGGAEITDWESEDVGRKKRIVQYLLAEFLSGNWQ